MLRLTKKFYDNHRASESKLIIEKKTPEDIFEKATQKAIAELQYKAIYKQMVMLAFDYNEEQFDIYQKYKDMYRFRKEQVPFLAENKIRWTTKINYHFKDYVIVEPTFEELIKALAKL